MKKKVLFFFATMFINICMAQSVKTYSVYDTNQSGDVNIADVTTEVDKVKSNVSATSTQQYVTAEDLSTLISDLKSEISSLKSDLNLIKEKLGISEGDTPSEDTHEYVDLGLPSGTLWATCNVGASSPEEYGLYFAWGETTGYSVNGTGSSATVTDGHSFEWANYKWCNGSYDTMTKYCTDSSYGTVDNKTELESADDAATANWGSNWCIPTHAQQEELVNTSNTSTEWTTVNGVYGRKITSKTNGNSLFLPAAGYRSNSDLDGAGSGGYYWSSELDSYDSNCAWGLGFGSSGVFTYDVDERWCGHSVRAVRSASQN